MQAKPLIGLRAGADLSSDSDDFYSESSFHEPVPTVRVSQSLTSVLLMVPKAEGQFDDINDIAPHISAFLENLKDFTIPTVFPAEVSFIPENVVPDELTLLLRDFVINPENDAAFEGITSWDSSEFPDAILAQIDLVKFARNVEVDLSVYADKKIDSRILSLVHYALGAVTEPHCAVYHTMVSLEEYLKFPSVAPLAQIFPEFTIDDLVRELCQQLIGLFPRHPFLASIVHNLAEAVPTVADVVNMLPTEEVSDSELSDSFFEELRELRDKGRSQQEFFEGFMKAEPVVNPLECVTLVNTIDTVTLSEPPHMLTYLLEDGTEEMTPMQFQNWIVSIRCERCEAVQGQVQIPQVQPKAQRCANSYQSRSLMSCSDDFPSVSEASVDFYLDLIRNIDDFDIKRQTIPKAVPAVLYSLYLPVLHTVNVTRESIELCGSLYSNMLTMERDGHLALKSGDIQRIERSINYFKRQVSTDNFDVTPVVEQQSKREQPPTAVDLPECFVSAMAIVNYEMMVNGRSPLSMEIFGGEVQVTEENEKLASRQWRAQYLWHLYTTVQFAPYMVFRLAFALAVNLSETNPAVSCNLLFEGLYTLVNTIPAMKKYPCVRSALLLFGKTLDRLNSYYYCAMVLDNFFLTDIRNASYSSEIAQVAQRNRDVIRALFHYNQSLKHFVAHETTDPAIYVGQNVAAIYAERAMYVQAMSVLAFLLHESYDIPIDKKREKMEVLALGSLRLPPRTKAKYVHHGTVFKPDPSNISTALSGASLVALFGKLRLYNHAFTVLDTVCATCPSASLQKLFTYIRMWLYHRQNDYEKLVDMIPIIEIAKPRASFLSHLGILTPNSLDTTLAVPHLMARIHLNRRKFQAAVFWSEILIHICQHVSLKDLGNAFLMRGLALLMLARSNVEPISLTTADVPSKIGVWIIDKKLTRQYVMEEALSSLDTAQKCYLRVGSCKKLASCRLWLADIALSEKMTPRSPQLFTKAKLADSAKSIKFDHSPIEIAVLMQDIDKLVSSLMHPLYIIHSEILMARYNLMNKELDPAKKRFGFALDNFMNLFVCGNQFLPDDFRLKTVNYCFILARELCCLLMEFDTSFINDRLFCFDLMNSLHALFRERLRVIDGESQTPISPSFDLSAYVLDLERPLVPQFGPLLIENGFITEKAEREPLGYGNYLAMIAANIRLFEQQKITEEEMTRQNRRVCKNIEMKSETIRRQRASQLPPDVTFEYLARSNPAGSGVVFVEILGNEIVVYVPSTGSRRSLQIFSSDAKPSLFQGKFLEGIAELVNTDKKAKLPGILKQGKICESAASSLFGDLLQPLSQRKVVIKPDDQSLGSKPFGKSTKGALVTTDPGPNPIVIVPSLDAEMIPFELLLPNSLVIRSPYYLSLLLKPMVLRNTKIPRPVICWNKSDTGARRSAETVTHLYAVFTGSEEPVRLVFTTPKTLNMPNPLCKGSKESEFTKRFDFCDFVEVVPNSLPKYVSGSSSIFIFTYTDICEMNSLVSALIHQYPFSSFMFIPEPSMRDAFREIRSILERHSRRQAQSKGQPQPVLEDPLLFATTLKLTLERLLKVPIPLVTHAH